MTTTIEEKLDLLAEYHSQKDSIELEKRVLLDEVKVPAEIEQIVVDGIKRASEIESNLRTPIKAFNEAIDAEIAAIIVPDEIKSALSEIDAQRAELDKQRAELMGRYGEIELQRREIAAKKQKNEGAILVQIEAGKTKLRQGIEEQTRAVYAQVANRKAEIEAEFTGKADAVDENIAKLEAEIKNEMKRRANEKLAANPKSKDLSVKGAFFHAIYTKARKTWIPVKLDDYTETHPDIKECYTEGEPSIVLRRI